MNKDQKRAAEQRIHMPYIQIDTNLWAVMRESKEQPRAMILGLANQSNIPQFFVLTWNPNPAARRVLGQYNTIEEANKSVLWNNSLHAGPKIGPDGNGIPSTSPGSVR